MALLDVDVGFPSEGGHELNSDYPSIFSKMRTLSGPPPAESWSAWCWTTKPSLSFIVASQNMDLSTEFAVLRRNLLTSACYQRMWPKMVTFAADQNRKEQYENLARGQMRATSMTAGSVHGKGADFLLLDDPNVADLLVLRCGTGGGQLVAG